MLRPSGALCPSVALHLGIALRLSIALRKKRCTALLALCCVLALPCVLSVVFSIVLFLQAFSVLLHPCLQCMRSAALGCGYCWPQGWFHPAGVGLLTNCRVVFGHLTSTCDECC